MYVTQKLSTESLQNAQTASVLPNAFPKEKPPELPNTLMSKEFQRTLAGNIGRVEGTEENADMEDAEAVQKREEEVAELKTVIAYAKKMGRKEMLQTAEKQLDA